MKQVSSVAIKGHEDLAAWKAARGMPGYPTVPDKAPQYALVNAVLDLDADAAFLAGTSKVTASQVRYLLMLLLRQWSPTQGYSYPSREWLVSKTGWSASTVSAVIQALRTTGLIGVVSGYKNRRETVASRYFPLFHSPSRKAFQEALSAREQAAIIALGRKVTRLAQTVDAVASSRSVQPGSLGYELKAMAASRAKGHLWQLPITASETTIKNTLDLIGEEVFQDVPGRRPSHANIMAVAHAIHAQKVPGAHYASMSRDDLASITGQSPSSVRNAIRALTAVGLVGIIAGSGRGNANAYYLLVHKTVILAFASAVAVAGFDASEDSEDFNSAPPF